MAFKRVGFGQVEPNKLIGIKTGDIHNSLPLDENVDVLQNGEFMYYDYTNHKVTADNEDNVISMPYMVWNEIKIYEDWLALKDFAMIRVGDNYVTNNAAIGRLTSVPIDPKTKDAAEVYGDGALNTAGGKDSDGNSLEVEEHVRYGYRMDGIAPRLLGTYIGDVLTTNMVDLEDTYEVGTTGKAEGQVLALHKTDRNTLELCTYAKAKGEDPVLAEKIKYVVAKDYTMPDGQRGFKLQRIV